MKGTEVHVYANARGFVVVPTVVTGEEERTEMVPVHRVSLVRGRPTVVELSRALRSAREASSEAGEAEAAMPWDGEGGRWWQHNLFFAVLRWEEDGVCFLPQRKRLGEEWESFDPRHYPPDVTMLELGESLVAYLGERLHGQG